MPTQAEVVATLHPVRLPADFARLGWQDGLAALSLGILAGLILLILVRPLLTRKPDPRAALRAELARIRTLPAQERLFRQAALLARVSDAVPRAEDWRQALYRKDMAVDLDALEARILQLARKDRG